MKTANVGNDVADRVIEHWNNTDEILPEALQMAQDRPDLFQELVDAIDVKHVDLLKELGRYRR